jgi:Mn-dependent DtxR family transcriptional regulator
MHIPYNIHMFNNMNIHNKSRILKFLKKNKVVTSSELAEFLKISWNTADKYLLELALEKKIERIKKQGVNLWMAK